MPSATRGVVWIAAILAMVVSVSAEATAAPAVDPDPTPMKQLITGEPRPASRPAHVQAVWPLRPSSVIYKVADSDLGPGRAAMKLTRGEGENVWVYHRLGHRAESIEPAADGSLLLRTIDNFEKGVIVRFEPALCVIPATLEPGKRYITGGHMSVVDRADTSHVRCNGTAKMTVVYDADQTLKTPAGTYDCRRVRVTCEAEFGWGDTRSVSTYYFAEGVGLVAEHYHSHTTLLLIPSHRQVAAVMVEPPAPMQSAGAQ